jgi:pre-mRNA-splicing factor RBM22/SLT11
MSESGYGIKRDGHLLNWEKNIFPIACDKCLGPQAYMRILKKPLGNQCKVCERPYTSFHWKIGDNPRFKKTQICSTCAKINNCCQVCIYDLEFGLPIDIRNRIMGDKKVEIMMSEGNRDVFAALVEENVDKLKLPYRKLGPKAGGFGDFFYVIFYGFIYLCIYVMLFFL